MTQTITDPPVPFVGPIKGGLTPGTMIRIQGEVSTTSDRFNINLHCGSPPSNIALHISVRLLQGYVARNSLENEDWGEEEDSGTLPIAPGQHFEVLVLCDPASYKIAVNGNHFCEFRHRIPFPEVSHLKIDGNVALGLIAFESASPVSAPPPPRPMSGGPDFSMNYDPPPPQGHYRQGPAPQPPFGGGPGYYPHGRKEEESGGFESFFGNAGSALAGVMVSGLAENLLSSLTGGGGQAHQQHPQGSMHPPQQPQYQGGNQHQDGNQHQTGGQHQSSLVGDLLESLASEMFKPSRRN